VSVLNGAIAPDWEVDHWFNAEADFSLRKLRGKVVFLHAFQMLCPGCVTHGIPQAQRVQAAFSPEQLVVVGLHSVFEHHAVMNKDALESFIYEYKLSFAIGVDRPGQGEPIPRTMRSYAMRGTPTAILIDRQGRIRWQRFGRPDDLQLGAAIGQLIAEPAAQSEEEAAAGCTADGCAVPT